MGLLARLFLPLLAVLAAGGLWLEAEYAPDPAGRGTVVALAPADDELGTRSPAAGPSGDRPAAQSGVERPARERFARPFTPDGARANVAVIVSGLGLEREATLRAIDELPPEVTLAFSPYGEDLAQLIERARGGGHEILLAAPMAPADVRRRDAGPAALTVMLDEAALRQRLATMLGRVHSHVGIVGDLGDRLARDPVAMRPVLDELSARGLLYVANRLEGAEPNLADPEIPSGGVPTADVTVWLDRELSGEGIDRQIAEAEDRAQRSGSVVVLARPYAMSVARIAAWMKTFERKALIAAPVSAIARGS